MQETTTRTDDRETLRPATTATETYEARTEATSDVVSLTGPRPCRTWRS